MLFSKRHLISYEFYFSSTSFCDFPIYSLYSKFQFPHLIVKMHLRIQYSCWNFFHHKQQASTQMFIHSEEVLSIQFSSNQSNNCNKVTVLFLRCIYENIHIYSYATAIQRPFHNTTIPISWANNYS